MSHKDEKYINRDLTQQLVIEEIEYQHEIQVLHDVMGSYQFPAEFSMKRKDRYKKFQWGDGSFKFITGLCQLDYASFFLLLGRFWPQVCFGFVLFTGYRYGRDIYDLQIPESVIPLNKVMGFIIGFLIIFRSKRAFKRYWRARALIGETANGLRILLMTAYSALCKANEEDLSKAIFLTEEIRRMNLLFFSMIRQMLREDRFGFLEPDLGDFSKHNFYKDPVRPRVCDIMLPSEHKILKHRTAVMRSTIMLAKINQQCLQLSYLYKDHDSFVLQYQKSLDDVSNSVEEITDLIDTPIPFPFTYILVTLLFFFIFSMPFMYDIAGYFSGYIFFGLTIICYYSTVVMSFDFEDPLGWGVNDLDLEIFGICLAMEMKAIASTFLTEPRNYLDNVKPTLDVHFANEEELFNEFQEGTNKQAHQLKMKEEKIQIKIDKKRETQRIKRQSMMKESV